MHYGEAKSNATQAEIAAAVAHANTEITRLRRQIRGWKKHIAALHEINGLAVPRQATRKTDETSASENVESSGGVKRSKSM